MNLNRYALAAVVPAALFVQHKLTRAKYHTDLAVERVEQNRLNEAGGRYVTTTCSYNRPGVEHNDAGGHYVVATRTRTRPGRTSWAQRLHLAPHSNEFEVQRTTYPAGA